MRYTCKNGVVTSATGSANHKCKDGYTKDHEIIYKRPDVGDSCTGSGKFVNPDGGKYRMYCYWDGDYDCKGKIYEDEYYYYRYTFGALVKTSNTVN